eukprot:335985_1
MGHAKSLESHRGDKVALVRYINSQGTTEDLNELWQAFDKDHNGSIDRMELEEIVFHLIIIFWEHATPQKQVPKRDQLQSVIDHICENIMYEVDKDKNGLITNDEFDEFGVYVKKQWSACTEKCSKKGNTTATFRNADSFVKDVGKMIS